MQVKESILKKSSKLKRTFVINNNPSRTDLIWGKVNGFNRILIQFLRIALEGKQLEFNFIFTKTTINGKIIKVTRNFIPSRLHLQYHRNCTDLKFSNSYLFRSVKFGDLDMFITGNNKS